jgi:hypothetical protein
MSGVGANARSDLNWQSSARVDPNNILVNIWGGDVVKSVITGPMSTFQVSFPDAGETVPWNHTYAPWWDYQALAPNAETFSFLAVWGGDTRLALLPETQRMFTGDPACG